MLGNPAQFSPHNHIIACHSAVEELYRAGNSTPMVQDTHFAYLIIDEEYCTPRVAVGAL